MADNVDALTEIVLNRATSVNYVLVTALAVLITSALLKLSGKTEFEIMKVPLNIKYLQIVMVAFTLAHLYTAFSFNIKIREVISASNLSATKVVFENLRDKGPLFFEGLVARLKFVHGPFGPIFVMDYSDPTTWLAHGAAVGAFFVMIRWKGINYLRRVGSIVGSAVIVLVNWLIGGGWAVHASCLSSPEMCKLLLRL